MFLEEEAGDVEDNLRMRVHGVGSLAISQEPFGQAMMRVALCCIMIMESCNSIMLSTLACQDSGSGSIPSMACVSIHLFTVSAM